PHKAPPPPPELHRAVSSAASDVYKRQAHVCGVSNWKIITRHIVPNVLGIVEVYSTLLIPSTVSYTHLRAHETIDRS
ncbi:hypothetical protein ACRTEE_23380, partial [Vibrio alginolyticus]